MKNLIAVSGLLLLALSSGFAQTSATYSEVISKQKRGRIYKYTTQKGEDFQVGDTISLGVAFRNEYFDFVMQNAGLELYELGNTAANSKVVIKRMVSRTKTLQVFTTTPQGYVFPLIILNFESAVINGEVKSKLMTPDQALEELKKWKDRLDLDLISQEEYDKKKEELSEYIK